MAALCNLHSINVICYIKVWVRWNHLLDVTVLQNFYLIDAHLCGLLVIITSRRLLYFIYKEVRIGF